MFHYRLRNYNFDIEKFKEAASYLPGLHDFTSFKKFDRPVDGKYKHNRRLLISFDVRPGQPLVTSYSSLQKENFFDYYDIYICGRSFVHNQVILLLDDDTMVYFETVGPRFSQKY